jgi:hypothetical protein
MGSPGADFGDQRPAQGRMPISGSGEQVVSRPPLECCIVITATKVGLDLLFKGFRHETR